MEDPPCDNHIDTVNQPRPGPRPYPAFGSLPADSNGASNYHAMQARSEWRLRHGLAFLSSYAWSKSIDDSSAVVVALSEPTFPQDSYDTRAERSLSTFHTAHRLSANVTYELPFLRLGRQKVRFNIERLENRSLGTHLKTDIFDRAPTAASAESEGVSPGAAI